MQRLYLLASSIMYKHLNMTCRIMPDRHKMIAIVPAGQNDGLFLSCTQESNFVYKTGPQKTQASLICTL